MRKYLPSKNKWSNKIFGINWEKCVAWFRGYFLKRYKRRISYAALNMIKSEKETKSICRWNFPLLKRCRHIPESLETGTLSHSFPRYFSIYFCSIFRWVYAARVTYLNIFSYSHCFSAFFNGFSCYHILIKCFIFILDFMSTHTLLLAVIIIALVLILYGFLLSLCKKGCRTYISLNGKRSTILLYPWNEMKVSFIFK